MIRSRTDDGSSAWPRRTMIGVAEHVWNLAREWLGHWIAATAPVLVPDWHCAGEAASSGGCLGGFVEMAGVGKCVPNAAIADD